MAKDISYIFEMYAKNESMTHEDFTKCGMCWQAKLRSDVAKEFIADGKTEESDLGPLYNEVDKRWLETSLYKEVAELLKSGKTMDEVAEIMEEKGVEI